MKISILSNNLNVKNVKFQRTNTLLKSYITNSVAFFADAGSRTVYISKFFLTSTLISSDTSFPLLDIFTVELAYKKTLRFFH